MRNSKLYKIFNRLVKRTASFVCVAALLLSIFGCVAFAEEDNNFSVSDAVIVISKNASITDSYAANRLKYYLDGITGGNIAIISDTESSETEISVGVTKRTTKDFSATADGSYIIISTDADVQILSITQADNGYYCQCENCLRSFRKSKLIRPTDFFIRRLFSLFTDIYLISFVTAI